MLSMHILLPKQSNLKTLGQFENLGFVIMSTRENIHLIARAPYICSVLPYEMAASSCNVCVTEKKQTNLLHTRTISKMAKPLIETNMTSQVMWS